MTVIWPGIVSFFVVFFVSAIELVAAVVVGFGVLLVVDGDEFDEVINECVVKLPVTVTGG